MKIFLSADIEGTTGIAHWNETVPDQNELFQYQYFAKQMTAEVAAACQGALDAGAADILVKDAHNTARNIDPSLLPEAARIFRGSGKDPLIMMSGLNETFDGVLFTGYHSAAGTDCNPLSHTMNGQNIHILINGQKASELMINCYIAAYFGVPVCFVSGDKGLCEWVKTLNPNIQTVSVIEGIGNGTVSIHPQVAVRRIREAVKKALSQDPGTMLIPLPDHFRVEIAFKEHFRARQGGFYPGAQQADARTVSFESDDYMDVLKFFFFVL